MKFFLLIFKNLRRNRIRTVLTALTVVLLVAIFCLITTILGMVDGFMAEKSRDIKLIVTERYRIPSRFDRGYVEQIIHPSSTLNRQLSKIPGFDAKKYTIWKFAGFTLDLEMKDKDKTFFLIATFPETIPYMTDDLEELDPELCRKMKNPPSGLPNIGILLGQERMKKLKKKIGDKFPAKSFTHFTGSGIRLPIEMDFEIVGELPPDSRWAALGMMDLQYLDRVLKDKKSDSDGKVDIAWLMVDDQTSAEQVSKTIEHTLPDLKCETLATAITRAMEPQKDFLWGLKFIVVPAIIVVMTVVVANAISITIRERTTEIALLKVLGYGRSKILGLIVGEGMLIGILGGLLGGGGTQALVYAIGGLQLGDAGPRIYVSWDVWWWGSALGACAALLGGFLPAWNACQVKVSEIFAKVA